MPCQLTRLNINNFVLDVLREMENQPNIGKETKFWSDLRVDRQARRGYFGPIKDKVTVAGCAFNKLKPQTFENAKDVQSIIDAICKDLKIK